MSRGSILLLAVSIVFLTASLIGDALLDTGSSKLVNYALMLAGLAAGALMVARGLYNYESVKYSFTMSFLALVFLIYIFVILLIDAYGYPQSFAVLLTPYTGVAVAGYLRGKIAEAREKARIRGEGVPLTRRIRNTVSQLDATMWFFTVFGLAYLTLFMVVPIVLVLMYSFTPPAGGEWWSNFYSVLRTRSYVNLDPIVKDWWRMIEIPGVGKILVVRGVDYGPVVNSLVVASIVTVFATLLGIIVAFVLARYRFPGHTLLRILAIVPLFNTPFINSYVVKLIWGQDGPVSSLFNTFFGFKLRVEGIVGVMLAQIVTFFPIVYLNAYNSFINIDPSTEEQAENLGAKGFRLFRTVTLPLALPGIAAGSILVFVFSLEDLGAPIVFNVQSLMSYKIYMGIRTTTGLISPEVAALGVVLLLLTLVSFLAIRNYVGMRSYAMISRGGRLNPRVRRPGLLGMIAVYLAVFPVVLFAMLPQVGVVLVSLGVLKPYPGATGIELSMPSDIFQYIGKVLSDPSIYRYLVNTLLYAGVSVLIAVFLATAVGYSVSRLKIKWLANILDSLSTSPLAIPGLVLALGYYYFFYILANALSQLVPGAVTYLLPGSLSFATWLVFIIAFSVRRLPYVVRSVFAGFQQVHENLEEAAMNLGASRMRVVFGVILPFIIGYILSGALLGFIYMATEVSTSITFGGMNDAYAPLTYYMAQNIAGAAGQGPMLVAAMGTILILIQLVVVVIVVYVFKQRYAFIGV
ncbi:ABC transporter permease [Desulfurococcus mucosus]|uniref:Binding-protein-dependent transport systems inner membrane component n=1 Tax=Desulfurococcus mucosus (strain ATCC 35584 / DSM 2162 / JCM 9187 / O7/1) TaxID=765177 RepID=E8R8I2_DESM0|nr:iron ABC transporter permease [Desulfurococcus mucosus]ADV64808.1 binding-protein-dependent transport systems inner membrane component [Desulfurococcus mucosus DSM 2162]